MTGSGFTVLHNLGIAFTGFDPDEDSHMCLGIFRRGSWD